MSDAAETSELRWLKLGKEDFYVRTSFERDNRNVDLYLKLNADEDDSLGPVASWSDDAVTEAVEDGFLSPKDWLGTAFDYAKSHGLLETVAKEADERYLKLFVPLIDAAPDWRYVDLDSVPSDFLADQPDETRKEVDLVPFTYRRYLEARISDRLAWSVGWKILDAEGRDVAGTEADPFGLDPSDVLVGDAIRTAREWVEGNPGHAMKAVRDGDVDDPRYVREVEARPHVSAPGA